MFLIAVVLSVGLTTKFAESFSQNINAGNPSFVRQQEPSTQGDQLYPPTMSQLSMEGNQQMYPMPQQSMMQQPMMQQPIMQQPMMQQSLMQGFQPPFSFNPINQQQLSLLLMSTYARMMALTQLMNMQNSYQPYQPQPNQYNDPVMNNFGKSPVPFPYVQQPQVELQNNFRNEMLQQQQQQAESQHQAILEERRIKREYDMEVERREELIKRKAKEDELEKKQKEIERQLRDEEEEIERERKEVEKQILEEEQKEIEQKEKDLKLREEEEIRLKKIEEEKLKKNQEKKRILKGSPKVVRILRKPISPSTN